jgi:hypothetical protein
MHQESHYIYMHMRATTSNGPCCHFRLLLTP